MAGLPSGVNILKTSNGRREIWRARLGVRFTGGPVYQQNFSSLAEARKWVKQQVDSGEAITALDPTPDQLAQARAAFSRMGDVPLDAAVSFYLAHAAPAGGRRTLNEVAAEYLQAKVERNCRDEYVRAQRYAVGVLGRDFGRRPIATIGAADLRVWFRKKGWEPLNACNYMRDFSMLFGFAKRRGYVPANPLDEMDRPRVPHKTPGIYSASEAEALLREAGAHPELGLTGWFAVGLLSGVRVAEMERLSWSAFDLVERLIHIGPKVAAKGGRPRNVTIPENLVAWLETIPERKGDFQPPKGRRNRLQKLFALTEARLEEAGRSVAGKLAKRNGLRHSFASHHYIKHASAELTRAEIGQESKAVLFRHYVQCVSKRDAAAYWNITPT